MSALEEKLAQRLAERIAGCIVEIGSGHKRLIPILKTVIIKEIERFEKEQEIVARDFSRGYEL